MLVVRGFCQSAADWVTSTGQGHTYSIIAPTRVMCADPVTGGGSKLSTLGDYITPPARVTMLPNARSIGEEGAVVTTDGHLITSSIQRFNVATSTSVAWDHLLSADCEIRFDGTVGVINHHGPRNFAHTLADRLPRVWLIRKAGIEPDAWLVPSHPPSWLSELLDLVGINSNRRISVEPGTTVTARYLVVPDGTGFAVAVAAWARTALLDLFGATDSCPQQPQRIWISRELSGRRRWLQEGEARRALEDRGFFVCHFEHQSIDWQRRMISGSKVVAGPHGAGLVWVLAASHPDGLLFEVAGRNLVHNDYNAVANVAGWHYGRTFHANVPIRGGDAYLADMDIEADVVIDELDLALARCKESP